MIMSDNKVRPWDLFNKKMNRAPAKIQSERLDICGACPQFIKLTSQCKKCGCFMKQKVKLADAVCPLNKWGKFVLEEVDNNE